MDEVVFHAALELTLIPAEEVAATGRDVPVDAVDCRDDVHIRRSRDKRLVVDSGVGSVWRPLGIV
jgi:hypothetical protein